MNPIYTIYKFELKAPTTHGESIKVQMQRGARIVHVGMQRGSVCLWAEVCTEARTEERAFLVRGTGELHDGMGRYVGTALDGYFVWHVYES